MYRKTEGYNEQWTVFKDRMAFAPSFGKIERKAEFQSLADFGLSL